jgi:RimJ/RimL family protein N-acetyltransferase
MTPLYAYPESVERDGLEIRWPSEADGPAVKLALDDPHTKRYLASVPDHVTDEFARKWCGEDAARIRDQHGVRYVVFENGPEGGRLVAGVTLKRVLTDRHQAEIGYWVAAEARQKGVAGRAVRAVVEAAFEAGLGRIELLAEPENPVSQRVALSAGFQREGVRRMAPGRGRERYDFVAYARLVTDSGEPVPRTIPDLPDGHLTDGVVTLRPIREGDLDDVIRLNSLPEVIATSFGDTSRDALRRRCRRAASAWIAGERADLVITDAATGSFAGDIGFFYLMPGLREGMIGYSLMPEFRGRGYATRAVELIARWAFDSVKVARLIAGTAPENEGSQRVLQRAGFVREAYLKDRLPGPDGGRQDDIQWLRLPDTATG